MLLDGLLAFRLLKPGGILVFDDYEWNWPHRHHRPKPAIDAFVTLHDYCAEVVHRGYQVAVRKAAADSPASAESGSEGTLAGQDSQALG